MYTGNSFGLSAHRGDSAVYPCVYRELSEIKFALFCTYGLSLCIQGTQFCKWDGEKWVRFIPVYTGNSNSPIIATYSVAVYPCVYRELIKFNEF